MGLDMYLYKEEYIPEYDDSELKEKLKSVGVNNVSTIRTRVAYWRKANAIHGYFVNVIGNGVDDCGEITATGKDILALKGIVGRLIDKFRPSLTEEDLEGLVPTKGFFFGSSEIDENYLYDLKETMAQLKDIDPNAEYIYQASW